MNILITGANGQLGCDLFRVLSTNHRVIGLTKGDLDITDETKVQQIILQLKPDAIIHTAAVTDILDAERDPEHAYVVNAIGTCNVAYAVQQIGAKLVYISTSLVFDGEKETPYTEFDRPNPLSVYGNSKLHGEKFIEMICDQYFIVRSGWLFGRHGRNFAKEVVAHLQGNLTLSVADPKWGSPTYTFDLAVFIHALLQTNHYGLYHASNKGSCSHVEFVEEIQSLLGKSENKFAISNSIEGEMLRPKYGVLDDLAIRTHGLPSFQSWQRALRYFLKHDYPVNR
ncbi:dTDP-4-dehydrorhamnose reductase [Paenibacillus sp. SYP-B3998]|uniref:dTDP-4-dehydrorhamnose reductase n=1 Tax=Paenibacillus sp. SYP-B3998 TaxID=2678564 RepID=A0A6G3ZS54_9BACL|nr:dTDP-4-dehydrorhamnose reductase [Paenibacillus sp. SYP-B3998]NEW04421.1 dTDP-4-dehydrorhamnose reductase [Paenibacillus sp. SYP-B3998]